MSAIVAFARFPCGFLCASLSAACILRRAFLYRLCVLTLCWCRCCFLRFSQHALLFFHIEWLLCVDTIEQFTETATERPSEFRWGFSLNLPMLATSALSTPLATGACTALAPSLPGIFLENISGHPSWLCDKDMHNAFIRCYTRGVAKRA